MPLAWITAGAAGAGSVSDLPGAATAGLIRSAQSEHPGRITHLDLDPEASEAADDSAALAVALTSAEPHAAVRDGTLLAPRLTRATPQTRDEAATSLDPDGTVLITGGTGGLGAHRRPAPASPARRPPPAAASAAAARTPRAPPSWPPTSPPTVPARSSPACDVADRQAWPRSWPRIPADHPLTAVVHAAGVLDDGVDRRARPRAGRTPCCAPRSTPPGTCTS